MRITNFIKNYPFTICCPLLILVGIFSLFISSYAYANIYVNK